MNEWLHRKPQSWPTQHQSIFCGPRCLLVGSHKLRPPDYSTVCWLQQPQETFMAPGSQQSSVNPGRLFTPALTVVPMPWLPWSQAPSKLQQSRLQAGTHKPRLPARPSVRLTSADSGFLQALHPPQCQAISYCPNLKTGSNGTRILVHPNTRTVPIDSISRMASEALGYRLTCGIWFQAYPSTRLNPMTTASRPATMKLGSQSVPGLDQPMKNKMSDPFQKSPMPV